MIQARAKERQGCGQGGILLCQKSDKPVDTKKELAKIAGVSHDTIEKRGKMEEEDNEKFIKKSNKVL